MDLLVVGLPRSIQKVNNFVLEYDNIPDRGLTESQNLTLCQTSIRSVSGGQITEISTCDFPIGGRIFKDNDSWELIFGVLQALGIYFKETKNILNFFIFLSRKSIF